MPEVPNPIDFTEITWDPNSIAESLGQYYKVPSSGLGQIAQGMFELFKGEFLTEPNEIKYIDLGTLHNTLFISPDPQADLPASTVTDVVERTPVEEEKRGVRGPSRLEQFRRHWREGGDHTNFRPKKW